MGGVGCFNEDGRTLYVGSVPECKAPPTQPQGGHLGDDAPTLRALDEAFGEWGEVENINYIGKKSCAFIRYRLRVNAEFAKEAMEHQSLQGQGVLTVRWANDDPNPVARAAADRANADLFAAAVASREAAEAAAASEAGPASALAAWEAVAASLGVRPPPTTDLRSAEYRAWYADLLAASQRRQAAEAGSQSPQRADSPTTSPSDHAASPQSETKLAQDEATARAVASAFAAAKAAAADGAAAAGHKRPRELDNA